MASTEEKLEQLRKNLDRTAKGEVSMPRSPMKTERFAMFKTSAGLIRAAVEANPEHPVAGSFKQGVRGLPDNTEVVVHRVDMEALLDNLEVLVEENDEQVEGDEGQPEIAAVVTKKLGGKYTPPKKAAKGPVNIVTHSPDPQAGSPVTPSAPAHPSTPRSSTDTEKVEVAETKDIVGAKAPPESKDALAPEAVRPR